MRARWEQGDVGLGIRLRAAREARGLSQDDVETFVRKRFTAVRPGWFARVEAGRQALWKSRALEALTELLPEAFLA